MTVGVHLSSWFLILNCSFIFDDAGIEAAAGVSGLVRDSWFVLGLVALAMLAIVFLILVVIVFIRVFIITTVIELVDALEWSFLTLIVPLWCSSTVSWFELSTPLEHLEQLLVECRWLLSTIPFDSFVEFLVFNHSIIRPSTATSVVTAAFVPGEGVKSFL